MRYVQTRLIIVVVASIGLASCQSEKPATGKTLEALGAQCSAYGFKKGSQEFATCLMQLDQSRIQTNIAKRQAVGEALGNIGEGMQRSSRNTVNCTSTKVGYSVQTRCY